MTELLSFITNSYTPDTFVTDFETSSGALTWNFGDGTPFENANDVSHVYTLAGNKTVRINQGTTSGASSISRVRMYYDGLIGPLNLSTLTGLNDLQVQENFGLTGITNPISSQVFQYYVASYCALVGTLDLSGLSHLGGNFQVDGNPNLTRIINPNSPEAFDYYIANSCNLTGTLVLTGLTALSGRVSVANNPNLTNILLPNSPVGARFFAYNCNLTGRLDMRGLTNLMGDFAVYNNPNLTGITHVNTASSFATYYVNNCNLGGDDGSAPLVLTGLTGLGGDVRIARNPHLRSILFPNSSQPFTYLTVNGCNLEGTLNLTGLTGLGGYVQIGGDSANTGIDRVLFPNSSQIFTGLLLYQTNLGYNTGGRVNLSGLTGLGGTIWLLDNPSLTGITNPVSSQPITQYVAYGCNLTGTLILSGLTGLGGVFNVGDNPNLTRIVNPISSQYMNAYYVYNSNLTGTLDISGLSGLGGHFRTWNNTHLTSIILPTFDHAFVEFDVYNCALGVSTIDNILAKLDECFTNHPPTEGFLLDLSAGTNAPPTGEDYNPNFVHIQQIFYGLGLTLEYYMNTA